MGRTTDPTLAAVTHRIRSPAAVFMTVTCTKPRAMLMPGGPMLTSVDKHTSSSSDQSASFLAVLLSTITVFQATVTVQGHLEQKENRAGGYVWVCSQC